MSRNIGLSKKAAEDIARRLRTIERGTFVYVQKEEHFPRYPNAKTSHQWIVVVEKGQKQNTRLKDEGREGK